MKLKDFVLSVRHINCCRALTWRTGLPRIVGNVPMFYRNQIDKAIRFKTNIVFNESVPEEIADAAFRKFNFKLQKQGEGYILNISRSGAEIYAAGETGRLYALQTLLRFAALEDPCECFICDAPAVRERGLKLYLPPPTEDARAAAAVTVHRFALSLALTLRAAKQEFFVDPNSGNDETVRGPCDDCPGKHSERNKSK